MSPHKKKIEQGWNYEQAAEQNWFFPPQRVRSLDPGLLLHNKRRAQGEKEGDADPADVAVVEWRILRTEAWNAGG
jgi:hypothetical protein